IQILEWHALHVRAVQKTQRFEGGRALALIADALKVRVYVDGHQAGLFRLTMPCCTATVTASVRLPTPSLASIEETWNLTVRSSMTSAAAISLLVLPCASSCSTSRSRSVNCVGAVDTPATRSIKRVATIGCNSEPPA